MPSTLSPLKSKYNKYIGRSSSYSPGISAARIEILLERDDAILVSGSLASHPPLQQIGTADFLLQQLSDTKTSSRNK